MSDTASSPIHILSLSDEEEAELLAQQPSTSSAVRDDSHGQPNAEESPLQVPEIPGSPRRPDELTDEQPQQSPAVKKQRITAYALDMESLPHDLKEFLQAVRWYFTQSVNLEREKAAVSMSTFSKCQERMLCKWRFLFMSVHFYYCCSSFVLSPLAQALNSCASRHAFSHFLNRSFAIFQASWATARRHWAVEKRLTQIVSSERA